MRILTEPGPIHFRTHGCGTDRFFGRNRYEPIRGTGEVSASVPGDRNGDIETKEEFAEAKMQRCRIHVAHNMDVADQVRSIFYASSKSRTIDFFESFKEKGKRIRFQPSSAWKTNRNHVWQIHRFPGKSGFVCKQPRP